jgi:alkylation response protein AidB-like acyl-CoA dehydrogenase
MARGEVISAIGMTEPGTGSDLANISTRATPHEGVNNASPVARECAHTTG